MVKLIQLIRRIPKTTLIPVVFVLGVSLFNVLLLGGIQQPFSQSRTLAGSAAEQALLLAQRPVLEIDASGSSVAIAASDEDTAGFVLVDSAAVLNANSPLSNILPGRDGLIVYKVKEGDNLSKIAVSFGISLNTILWANGDVRANLIRAGQEIVILPVSGVLHHIAEGETLDAIASTYDVTIDQILKYNDPSSGTLIIPGAKPTRTARAFSSSGLPSLAGYFVIPTTGWNWGRLHATNAVDIANACGTPIYAAAEGLVIASREFGYNSGYGGYIEIEHPNGVITRYAHNNNNEVSEGDYVLQGDLIGHIGNTGNTHGPTGCHLHFEVKGAQNPFVK